MSEKENTSPKIRLGLFTVVDIDYAMSQGMAIVILSQAEHKFGPLEHKTRQTIKEQFDYWWLRSLGIALIDMQSEEELIDWLQEHTKK